ncbi:MAG: hypothetical protein Q7S02_00635, partial [bacterium]|nr:hypothetical protein [bacterium]
VWAKVVVGFILRSSDTVRWVIEDLRYPSEVAALLDARGPLLLWKVTRPDDQRGDIGRPKGHESETALATYDGWDSVLTNDGSIAELHVAVEMALTLWRARS